jgi:hypothetical protein
MSILSLISRFTLVICVIFAVQSKPAPTEVKVEPKSKGKESSSSSSSSSEKSGASSSEKSKKADPKAPVSKTAGAKPKKAERDFFGSLFLALCLVMIIGLIGLSFSRMAYGDQQVREVGPESEGLVPQKAVV